MTHGSLFSGIGGFDLAAQWMGWENKFHCEWNEFGQRVLHYYWPDAELFTDITKSDFKKYANKIDVLTGGFPCQPYSSAGKRMGKEDERHLWPEMLRAIREIAPRWVVGENVRGLTNWNGGMVFDEVCTDLENLGYQVAPYLIPASGVNAPHKRERIWFVAYRNATDTDSRRWTKGAECKLHNNSERSICTDKQNNGNAVWSEFSNGSSHRVTSDTDSNGLNECNGKYEIDASKGGIDAFNDIDANDERGNASDTRLQRQTFGQEQTTRIKQFSRWENFPTQSPICGRDDGLPTELDGITFSKWRNESIKAYGNAVVPQVVYQIFKAIESYERIR